VPQTPLGELTAPQALYLYLRGPTSERRDGGEGGEVGAKGKGRGGGDGWEGKGGKERGQPPDILV